MLSKEQIEKNKETFLNLLDEITIEDTNIEGLKQYLLNSDFFTAPASAKYHSNYEGGLCQHSLNVYANLCTLVDLYAPGRYFQDSLKVVGLLHDISKANTYEIYMKNVNTGKKDEKGKDIWVKEPEYKFKEAKDRLTLGDHESNSLIIIQRYIPLLDEEIAAILNHHGGWGMDSFRAGEVSAIFEKYPLATLLHLADMASVYIDERKI